MSFLLSLDRFSIDSYGKLDTKVKLNRGRISLCTSPTTGQVGPLSFGGGIAGHLHIKGSARSRGLSLAETGLVQ